MTSSSRKVARMFRIKFPTKRIFRILRTDGMAPFCNLFIERPLYIYIYILGCQWLRCCYIQLCQEQLNLDFSCVVVSWVGTSCLYMTQFSASCQTTYWQLPCGAVSLWKAARCCCYCSQCNVAYSGDEQLHCTLLHCFPEKTLACSAGHNSCNDELWLLVHAGKSVGLHGGDSIVSACYWTINST